MSTDMYNDADVEAAWGPPPYEPTRAWFTYAASKVQAEKELWAFVRDKKPHFVVNSILLDTNMGEIFSPNQAASTGQVVPSLYKGDLGIWEYLPPQWMVNVKDTARLHVAGLILPEVENERIMAFAFPFNFSDILDILRKKFPGKTLRENAKDEPRDLSVVDNRRGEELLKALGQKGWTGLEESVTDNMKGVAT